MYIIEGNIGAGKSTFLKLAQENLAQVSVAFEPLHNWQSSVYGQSLLSNFYQNPKRWAYTLEALTLMCRVREQIQLQEKPIENQLVERSIYSGYYCFAQNGFEQGFMSEIEWDIYTQWFNFLLPNKCAAPKGFIYLKIDPEIAYERIKKRNRLAEKTITLQYLKQIHARHESFLLNDKHTLPHIANVPVLVLDCNQEFETDSAQLKNHLDAVQEFLKRTQPAFKPAVIDQAIFRELLYVKENEQQ